MPSSQHRATAKNNEKYRQTKIVGQMIVIATGASALRRIDFGQDFASRNVTHPRAKADTRKTPDTAYKVISFSMFISKQSVFSGKGNGQSEEKSCFLLKALTGRSFEIRIYSSFGCPVTFRGLLAAAGYGRATKFVKLLPLFGESVKLMFKALIPPPHANFTCFFVRLAAIPALKSDAIHTYHQSGPIRAAPAVDKNGIISRISQDAQESLNGVIVSNQPAGVERYVNIFHSQFLDDVLFLIPFWTKIDDRFYPLLF